MAVVSDGSFRVGLVAPTRNAGAGWPEWLDAVGAQDLKPAEVLVVDSSSCDGTAESARGRGYRVDVIPVEEFNHGRTRQQAIRKLEDVDVVVMLTQDAMLFDRVGLSALVAPFYDKTVGASFGRHLPRVGADPIEAHARLFNYPVHSRVVGAEDIPELGIKAAAISNSFAAYRMTALDGVGGFPTDVILCEDVYVAAKMLMSGWKIAYCGNAVVRHSHDYSWWQEFKRYFDIGVFHSRERWILERFGKPQGEGARFVKSEIKYVWQTAPRLIVPIVFRTASKILGYHLGRVEGVLPVELKRRFSMHSAYWERKRTGVVVG